MIAKLKSLKNQGFKGELYFNDKFNGTFLKRTDSSKLNNMDWKHKIELKKEFK